MRRRKYTAYAARNARFANFLLDTAIFSALFFGISGALLARSGQGSWSDAVDYPFSGAGGKLALILTYLAYYVLTESLWGKSPAKFFTRTRVIDSNGGDADWAAICGRTLFRLIPFEAVSFLFGANWHDRFSNTNVVSDR